MQFLTVKEICAETRFGDTYVRAVKAAMEADKLRWPGGKCALDVFWKWLENNPNFRVRTVYFSKKAPVVKECK